MTITPVSGTDDLLWLDAAGVRQSSMVIKTVNAGSVDSNGNLVPSTASMVDTNNTTSTNLANGAVFTGTGTDVGRYATIVVSVYASHASVTNGLSFQFSTDNANWRVSDTYSIPATTLKTFAVQVQFQYFRIVYTNGGTLTTTLNVQTLLKSGTNPVSSQKPAFARTLDNDMQETISYTGVYNGTTLDLDTKPNAVNRLLSSAASVNSTLVRAGATNLFNIDGYNSNSRLVNPVRTRHRHDTNVIHHHAPSGLAGNSVDPRSNRLAAPLDAEALQVGEALIVERAASRTRSIAILDSITVAVELNDVGIVGERRRGPNASPLTTLSLDIYAVIWGGDRGRLNGRG